MCNIEIFFLLKKGNFGDLMNDIFFCNFHIFLILLFRISFGNIGHFEGRRKIFGFDSFLAKSFVFFVTESSYFYSVSPNNTTEKWQQSHLRTARTAKSPSPS